MSKALALGFGILLAAHGAWLGCLLAKTFSQAMLLLLWLSPLVAAIISAYVAPSKKIIVGASMAIPATILAGALNLGYEALGNPVDFPGPQGAFVVVKVTLVWTLLVCTAGGIGGYFLARKTG